MVLYFLVIWLSLLYHAMLQFWSISGPLCVFDPKCLGYNDKEEFKSKGTKTRRRSSSSGYDRAISRSERCIELLRILKRRSQQCQKREEICKRAFCAFGRIHERNIIALSSTRFCCESVSVIAFSFRFNLLDRRWFDFKVILAIFLFEQKYVVWTKIF